MKIDKYDYIWLHDALSKSLIVLNSSLNEKYTIPGHPIALCKQKKLKIRLSGRYGIQQKWGHADVVQGPRGDKHRQCPLLGRN